MGLFDFMKKKAKTGSPAQPGAAQRAKPPQGPQTFEEWADYMLTQTETAKVSEAAHLIRRSCTQMPVEQSLPLMAWLANRTDEIAQSDMNRKYALEIFGQILYFPTYAPPHSGPKTYMDVMLTHPDETAEVEKAIWNLYQNGGDMVRDAIRYMAFDYDRPHPAGVNPIGPAFLRPVLAETLEDETCRRRYTNFTGTGWHFVQHDKGFQADNDRIFPMLDVAVRHRDDMTPELREELAGIYKKQGLLWPRASLSDYFRTVYLPAVGRADDAALADWFAETFCAAAAG